MSFRSTLICGFCAVVLATGTCGQVEAQAIDYGSFEALFGEPVTASATGQPQRMSEVPMTMEILTQEDIRRSGAVDLPEVLRQVNGVDVVQKGELGYDVGVRGYNKNFSESLLVLVNGRQVYLDYFGFTEWPGIPVQLEEIRQIEIVKGPNTALFGFNAVSGVINIVTYSPLYDDVSSAGITVGTNDYRKAHYVQSFKVSDKVGVRVSGGSVDMNEFGTSSNGTSAILDTEGLSVFRDPQQQTLNLDAMFQLTDNSQLRVEFSDTNISQGHIVPNGDAFREDHELRSGKMSYQLCSDLGLVKAVIYRNTMDMDSLRQNTASPPGQARNEVWVAQLEDIVQLNPNHIVRVQGEFRRNSLRSDIFLLSGAEVSYNVYALGSMWDWRINDELSWTNAIRGDRVRLDRSGVFTANNPHTNDSYDTGTTEYSYNSGLVWKPTDKDTLRLSTARGLEVPSLFEYGVDFIAGPVTLIGNPTLKVSSVTNYELAWDREIEEINGLFRSSVFYQETRDVQSYRAQTVFPIVLTKNIGDSKTYGIELSLNGQFDNKFDWGVGYIFQEIDDDLENGKDGLSIVVPREYEDSNPEHQLNFKLGYQEGPWEANALAYYVSDRVGLGYQGTSSILEEIDSYIGVNGRVAYTFDSDLTLALHGQQLQGSQTQTSVAPDVERRIFLSLTKKF